MFDRIGEKIKTLAVISFALGVLASLIGAIALWAANSHRNPTVFAGICVLVGGSLASWIGSFFTYGFGELIEETSRNREINQQILNRLNAQVGKADAGSILHDVPIAFSESSPSAPRHEVKPLTATGNGWVCKSCGTRNISSDLMCKDCGKYK